MIEPRIRFGLHVDRSIVADLEGTYAAHPRTLPEINILMSDKNTHFKVVEMEGNTAGYMIYEINRHSGQLGVILFGVHPDYADIGIDDLMMDALSKTQSLKDLGLLLIVVHEDDLTMQLYLRNRGLVAMFTTRGPEGDHYVFCGDKKIKSEYMPHNRIAKYFEEI